MQAKSDAQSLFGMMTELGLFGRRGRGGTGSSKYDNVCRQGPKTRVMRVAQLGSTTTTPQLDLIRSKKLVE